MLRTRLHKLLLSAAILACPVSGGTTELTLEQAIDLALTDGYEARTLKLQLKQAEEDRAAASGRSATQVDLVLDSPNFAKQVQSVRLPDQLPAYNTVGTLQWRGQLQITKPFVATNTTVSLSSDFQQRRESVFRDQSDATEKRKEFQSQFRLSLQQPLLTPNTLKLNLERADLQLERTRRRYTESQLDVIYNVTQGFYQWASARRQYEIAKEDVARQERVYEMAETRFEMGAIVEMELLQIEADLAESRNALIAGKGGLERSADLFKQTVGLNLAADVTPRPDFRVRGFAIDSARAVSHALKHRSDMREREIDRRLAEITLKETDARNAIKGNLTAYYDRTGVSDPFLPYSSGVSDLVDSSWEDLRRRPQNLGLRFTLTVPLWDGRTNSAEVAAARLALAQRDLDSEDREVQVVRAVRSAISQVLEARARLNVLEKGLEVARRSYEMSEARFEMGAITALELSDSHGQLTRAQLNQLDAYIQYRLAAADLTRQTLYDFEKGRSLVEEE
jgi:outer membrane protein TolC